MNPAPTMAFETAGPQHIEVEQFDGFGPMGTASLEIGRERHLMLGISSFRFYKS